MNRRDEERSRTGYGAGWLIGAGLGAACMYFSDPTQGARRRALLRDKLVRAADKTADGVDATARDLRHRVEGALAAVRGSTAEEHVSDEILVERARAKMGRYVSHPHAIDVYASNGGIELYGQILRREVPRLVRALSGVRGVRSVQNYLEEHDEPGRIPALQGGVERTGQKWAFAQTSWSPAARAAAGGLGSSLVGYGAMQRSALGGLMVVAGSALILRAAVGDGLKLDDRVRMKSVDAQSTEPSWQAPEGMMD
jgi:hypothetical protein